MNNLISTFIGALIAIMVMVNGSLSKETNNYLSIIIIHLVGLIAIILVHFIKRLKIPFGKGIPLYLYSAGAIGVFTVFFNNFSIPVLGVSLSLSLGLLGQSFASIIFDHFGLMGMKIVRFEKKKLIGLAFITLGIFVMAIY